MSEGGWPEAALDWLAVPECASALLDRAPAWVFSRDGSAVFWANPTGGERLGVGSFSALSRLRLPETHLLRRDVASISRSLGARGGLGRLRFLGGLNAEPVSCRCAHVTTPAGKRGIFLIALTPRRAERGMCEVAVAFLAADGIAAGLYDSSGRREAASLGDSCVARLHALDLLGTQAAEGTERTDGDCAIGTAAVTYGGARLFLVLAELLIKAGEESSAPTQASAKEQIAARRADSPIVAVSDEVQCTAAKWTAQTIRLRPPTRFLWETDANDRVLLVSPGLSHIVGRHANIVGERWREAARRLDLDPTGRIAVALATRDTWSGLTAWWPLDGEELRVPAELTGLPVFSADGAFQGFRGFGILKPADALTQDAFDVCVAVQQVPALPRGEARADENAVLAGSNVVPIRGDRDTLADFVRLSPNERMAFEEIAAALGARVDGEAAPRSAISEATIDAAPPDSAPAANVALPATEAVPVGELPDVPGDAKSVALVSPETFDGVHGRANGASENEANIALGVAESGGDEPIVEVERVLDAAPVAIDAGSSREQEMGITPFDLPDEGTGEAERVRTVVFMPSAFHVPAPPVPPEARSSYFRDEPPMARAFDDVSDLIALLETAADAVLVVDRHGRITAAGHGAEAMLGMDGRPLPGRSIFDSLTPRSRSVVRQHLADLLMPGAEGLRRDASEIEASIGGAFVSLLLTASRPAAAEGRIFVCLRDVSMRAQAEAALAAAREAAALERMEFLARLSDEIRAPLNAIAGVAATMGGSSGGAGLLERRRERLRDMREAAEHVLTLVSDLSDIARIEAGARSLSPAAAPLNDIVREVIALAQPDASRAHVILRSSLSAEVPPVIADPSALRQAVLDLVSQSVRFAGAGGQVIASTTLAESGEAILRIRDTGEARSGEMLARTLMPFRADEPSERYAESRGSLALGKALVEANHARFSLRSAQGEGTIMSIVFPATRVLSE